MAQQTTLSAMLKRYRLAAGLSQEALAERAGLSVRAISDLERGLHRAPRASTIELLATALALSLEQRATLLAAARPNLRDPPRASSQALPSSYIAPPSAPTATLGRERERGQAREALLERSVRLLTLTGPGGVGKTRLGLQIAQDLADAFPDGVVFVDLAPIRDPALFPGALCAALGLREQSGTPADERVLAFLGARQILLVLDNCEHLLDATPQLAPQLARLLERCPRLCLLATSRVALRLRAEQRLPVSPLEAGFAAELFRERVRAAQPDRALDAAEVAAICAQLDHLPLAIELAAAQMSALSAADLRARLSQRLPLLVGRMRDLPARQQTMAGAIAWSYELLGERQQRWFRGLSVFAGGWTLEAAYAVCSDDDADDPDDARMLADLIDASVIQARHTPDGALRFSQLDLLREFARGRLREAGEERLRGERHAHYFARIADIVSRDGPTLRAPDRASRLDVVAELANARAALEWTEAAEEAALGLRLAGFGRLWDAIGQTSEAVAWEERMLALDARAQATGVGAAPLALRVERLYAYARTLLGAGAYERAEASAAQAVALAEQLDDAYVASNALMTLGMITQALGRYDEAASAFTASYERMPASDTSAQRYRALSKLAEIVALQGSLARAVTLLERALADAEASDNQWDVAHMATLLGRTATQMQRYTLATRRFQSALRLFRDFASPRFSAWCLEGYAATLSGEERHVETTRLLAAAGALRERVGAPAPAAEREVVEQALAAALLALGKDVFRQQWRAGARLGHEEALDDALAICARRLSGESAKSVGSVESGGDT